MKINKLDFKPLQGASSPHFQMILYTWLPSGKAPPSERLLVDLGEGDFLSCEVSTPPSWNKSDETVVLVHGMGGSHASSYMVRLSKKLYHKGTRVVRVNLRECGSGKGLSKVPYNAGTSSDVFKVIQLLKEDAPDSDVSLVGFSLGGNVTLKLAGELGKEASKFVKTFIAVCAPLDLAAVVRQIQERRNHLYHKYYLRSIRKQAQNQGFLDDKKIECLMDFDRHVTAPLWGYKEPEEYYKECSSMRFLPHIQQSTHLLFSEDDPFISFDQMQDLSLPDHIHLWTTNYGGHMSFLGRASKEYPFYWMDHLLLNWLDGDFESNLQKS